MTEPSRPRFLRSRRRLPRKPRPAALTPRDARFRFLVENSRDIFFSMRLPEGRFEYISSGVTELHGLTPQQFYDDPGLFLRCVAPAWLEQTRAWIGEVLGGVVREKYEFEVLDRAGRLRWIELRLVLVAAPDGQGHVLQGVASDKTEERAADLALRESEARYRQLAEGWGEQVIMRIDLASGRHEYVSPSVVRVFGFAPEEFYRGEKRAVEAVAPEWRETVARWMREAAGGELAPEYEYEIIDAWGRRHWVHQRGVLLRAEDGAPQAAQFVLFDNTERKALELELESSRTFLDCIIEQSPVSLCISDAEGAVIRTNQALRGWLGYGDEEMVGSYNIFSDRQIEAQGLMPLIRRVHEQGGAARFTLDYDIGRGEGREADRRTLDVTISAVQDAAGRTTNLIVQHLDITEQKRAQEEVAHKDALLSAMLRNMPFDFWARDMNIRSIMQSDESVRLWGDLGADEEHISEETRLIWRETDRKVMAQSPLAEERTLLLPSGERRTFQSVVAQIRDGEATLGLLGVNVDITERKAAEEALRRSAERYDELARRIPVGVYLFSLRNGVERFEYVSPRLCEMLGLEESAFAEGLRPFRPAVHPEDREDMVRAGQDALERIAAFHWEGRFLVRGEERWLRIEAEPAAVPGGAVWSGVVSDVTQRRLAEEALSRSERRFAALIRNSFDTINILDAQGRQLFVSDAVRHILGFTAAELTDIPVIETMIHPEDRERVRASFAKVLQEGAAWVQYRHRHKDGSWVHLEAWGTNQLDNPDIGGVVVNVRDITDRKQAEEALARQSRLWRRLLESMHEGVWAFDAQRRTIFANERLAAMTGYSLAEIKDMDPTDMLDPAQAQLAVESFQEPRLGLSGSIDFALRRKDGSLLPARVSSAPIQDEAGAYEGLVCSVVDLTERKRMEGQLRRNQARFETLYELSRLSAATERQLAAYTLRQALRLTESDAGVLFFVDAGQGLLEPLAWEGPPGARPMGALPVAGPTPWTTVFATCQPLVLNDFSAYRDRLPAGHAPVERFLGVPALDGDQPAAILGISGKPAPYTADDSLQVSLLMDGMWRAVRSRRDEERIRASLREKEALLREVHHRVKNNLQVVSSLLDMAGRRLPDEPRRGLEEVRAKVQAMGLIHAQLHGEGTAGGEGGGIDLERYVRALFRQLREVYSGDMELTLDVRLGPLKLGLDAATPLGLALNEALANAFRHARPAQPKGRAGRVRIEAWREPDGRVNIEVQDDGPGLPEELDPERSGGLGMKLMFGLVRRQLGGELSIAGGGPGTRVRIRFRPASPA